MVYTLPRWEKRVAATLYAKGIEHYCPLNKVRKKWSDRYKIVEEPLFKGYVFVQPNEGTKWDMKKIPGIINFVYWLGKPALVKEDEIVAIKKFMNEFDEVIVTKAAVNINDEVFIRKGLFMDYKGIVLQVKGNQVRLRIQSLALNLEVTIAKADILQLKQVFPSEQSA